MAHNFEHLKRNGVLLFVDGVHCRAFPTASCAQRGPARPTILLGMRGGHAPDSQTAFGDSCSVKPESLMPECYSVKTRQENRASQSYRVKTNFPGTL